MTAICHLRATILGLDPRISGGRDPRVKPEDHPSQRGRA